MIFIDKENDKTQFGSSNLKSHYLKNQKSKFNNQNSALH